MDIIKPIIAIKNLSILIPILVMTVNHTNPSINRIICVQRIFINKQKPKIFSLRLPKKSKQSLRLLMILSPIN